MCKQHPFNPRTVASGGGGGRRKSPGEIGKIVEENWCYLPGVYTFGEDAKIPEIFSKNGGKYVFHREFD